MESPPSETEQTETSNSDKKAAKDNGEPGQGAKKPGSKAQGRKRTKTGCLTCRRRRIKCGEERPTCQNCAKSKRQCEGYNQRVVFKDPLNAYRGPPISAQVQFSEPIVPLRHGGDPFQQPGPATGPMPIAPKPPRSFGIPVIPQETASNLPAATSPGVERRVYGFNSDLTELPTPTTGYYPGPVQKFDAIVDTVDRSHLPEPRTNRKSPPRGSTHYDFEALEPIKQESREELPTPSRINPLDWSAGPSSASPLSPQELLYDSNNRFSAPTTFYRAYPSSSSWQPPPISSPPVTAPLAVDTSNTPILHSPQDSAAPQSGTSSQYDNTYSQLPQQHLQASAPGSDWNWEQPMAIQGLYDHPVENDDDPYDVSGDDEDMEGYDNGGNGGDGETQDLHLRNNDLGVVVALQARQEAQTLSLRSITSYIDRPNMLATYVPSPQASPLQDPMAARIFCHFINVTGPTMSMFERHPANPSLIFQGHPVPKSQHHIWTYTFPTLALHNQGLLHAMLAVASLHIAKLQDGPITASLRHYAFGLRKVAKSVSLHNRRGHPATLAAAMLLAFYECWCADHQKWSNHLLGAKTLVKEIDFAGMTKYIKATKSEQRRATREREYQAQQLGDTSMHNQQTSYQGTEDVDENIVSMLMGKKLRYDQYGRILEDNTPNEGESKTYTERELEIYEVQRDLFWWYCKQDTYQSILGGGRLFMEYDRWSHCPPRAPLGRLSATYGTFDHLILLMGRLADFASRDVKRKRLAMKANGGYRPPGMPAQAPGQQGQQARPQPPPQMPSFNGMVPDVGEPKLPMGFETSRDQSPQSTHSTQSEDMDLERLAIEAEEEWQEIRNAFSVLEDHFGDDFQALGPEFSATIQTPFGPALQYRTYGIAGIWMNYYMALITCHRAHPSMPPAAMMASGIAARHTDFFANEIGRIAAGIAPDCSMMVEVAPGVGAALIESATALFIAGVQYHNSEQRHWTVNRLRDIARLTGWQTAHAICTGIETSWVKVAEAGKGPPYVRSSDDRIIPDPSDISRRLDRAFAGANAPGSRLVIGRSDRVHYALGVLGVESDFDNIDLDNDEDA